MNFFEQIAEGLYERYILYGDSATKTYLERMKEGKWETNSCPDCQETFFPPRKFCPSCLKEDLHWISLPRKGKILAFTSQERALFFGKPDCIGFIELENGIRVFAPILASYDKLSIGDEVEQDWFSVIGKFQCVVFKPA